MKWLIDNWTLLVVVLAVVGCLVFYFKKFVEMPYDEQVKKVREWLLFAVIEAEKTFKNGTGALKLRWVYDKFLERFPTYGNVITFETFAKMVDVALKQMHHLIDTNLNIFYYVNDDNEE